MTWRLKETDREATFNESMKAADMIEGRLRQKALDLQRREERIV
jgi:hypothetical protein